jgi:hypothetical protein
MTPAPVNLFLQSPTIPIFGWDDQASKWERLNKDIGGNPDFYPLTVKAFYIIGIMLGSCRSVSLLLRDPNIISSTYYPAYAIFSSIVDLLGRCIRGNATTRGIREDVKAGFQWLAAPDLHRYTNISEKDVLIKTPISPYSISNLIMLRHFTAHGQATTESEIPPFDYFILDRISPKIPPAMESYWALLQNNEHLCNQLAKANVKPYRNRPIFDSLLSFQADSSGKYMSIGDAFASFDWKYKQPTFDLQDPSEPSFS